jgi:hypothetical protein
MKAYQKGRGGMKAQHVDAYREAVVEARQTAAVQRAQGLNDEAAYLSYRAQVLQRKVYWGEGRWWRWLFSGALNVVAGYGYRPLYTLIVYIVTITAFAAGIYLVSQGSGNPFSQWGALIFSITSFHGRGFFPGISSVDDPLLKLVAAEAVLGLFIEICFIAAFTQRFLTR